jgi:hypothetical protein
MGPPLLIGAGLGALTSAAMGKSPFTGALLGGATGGMFGGAGGLFGAAPSAGVSGLASVAPAAATAGEIAIPSTSLLEGVVAPSVGIPASSLSGGLTNLGMEGIGSGFVPNAGVQLSSNALTNGLDYGINAGNTLAGGESIYQSPSFWDKIKSAPSNLGNQATNWVSNNPISAGKMALDMATPTPTPPIQHQGGGIIRHNFEPSSTIAATPTYNLSKEEVAKAKVGQIANMAHLTEPNKRKIDEFYTSLIG